MKYITIAKKFLFVTWIALLLASCSSGSKTTPPALTQYTQIAANYGSHCYRGAGAAYYKNEKTYFTWPGPGMNSYVGYFDHRNNTVSSSVLVNTFDDYSTWAYHDYSRIVAGDDGRLHLFACDHTTALYYYRSPLANDITGTWERTVWSEDAGYPFPIATSTGRLFIFYIIYQNRTPPVRPLFYRTSSDNGTTWSGSPVKCIDRDIDNWRELYVGSVKYAPAAGSYPDRILMTWTLSGVSGDGSTTAHDVYHKDVYFAYLNVDDLNMYSADQTNLGPTVAGAAEWDKCRVLDTGASLLTPKIINYTHNVMASTLNGRPMILYEKYDYTTSRYEVFSRFWNGTGWSAEILVRSGSSIGDAYYENGFNALCRSSSSIYGYQFDENSLTWSLTATYTPPVSPQNMMLIANYNGGGKAKFMIFESYGSTYDYTGNNRIYTYNPF